ncbi:hypothetical protein ACLB2K_008005 [Fragaria x ananassa]
MAERDLFSVVVPWLSMKICECGDGFGTRPGNTVELNNQIITYSNVPHFIDMVNRMSKAKRVLVRYIGFGTTVNVGCCRVVPSIFQLMVGKIDIDEGSVWLNGRKHFVNQVEVSRVLGLEDGGEAIQLGEGILPAEYGEIVSPLLDACGNISFGNVSWVVSDRPEADATFAVAYGLLALTCFICPGNSTAIDPAMLKPLMDVDRISCKNWATFAIERLFRGIRVHRETGIPVVEGSAIFLQVLYCELLVERVEGTERRRNPLMAWNTEAISNLLSKVVAGPQDIEVNNEAIVSEDDSVGYPLQHAVHRDIFDCLVKVEEAHKQMGVLINLAGEFPKQIAILTNQVLKLTEEVCNFRPRLKDNVRELYRTGRLNKGVGSWSTEEVQRDIPHRQHSMFQGAVSNSSRFVEGVPHITNMCPSNNNTPTNGKRSAADAFVDSNEEDQLYMRQLMGCTAGPYGEVGFRGQYFVGPYQLRYRLSVEERRIIDLVFLGSKTMTVGEMRTQLASCGNGAEELIRIDACTLHPGCYVGSAKRATAKGKDESYEEWVKDTRVVCRLDRFDGQLATCEKIFIPVHEGNDLDGHWILLVVYVKRGITELWDSAGGARLTDGRHAMIQQVLEHVDRVTIQECMTGNSGRRRWISKGSVVEPLHVPKQANGFDCGVYVMGNMIYFGTNWANQFNSDEFRSEILLECLRAPNNELHEVIQATSSCNVIQGSRDRAQTRNVSAACV